MGSCLSCKEAASFAPLVPRELNFQAKPRAGGADDHSRYGVGL